ncbi:hypothetical protein [Actinopolymorpha rutila]|uniref:Uncharacterized protein n=1 Tax=Actinopolymorpha rutila TaxID=446787 RepID=A0A852ZDH0_9ACTN|nr:hypothetical protein [Actinopolymorpha rutila]NYH89858.1 hypothetical protein [Actinopolymorpha rutila]
MATTPERLGHSGWLPTSYPDVGFLLPQHDRPPRPETEVGTEVITDVDPEALTEALTELDHRASDLASIHRPDRDPFRWQLRWGSLPWLGHDRPPLCVFCRRPWLCPPAAWAHAQLSTPRCSAPEHPSQEAP